MPPPLTTHVEDRQKSGWVMHEDQNQLRHPRGTVTKDCIEPRATLPQGRDGEDQSDQDEKDQAK